MLLPSGIVARSSSPEEARLIQDETQMEEDTVGFREAVQYLREQSGLSARALGTMVGLSPSYVRKMERGEIQPSFRVFAKIALALNMGPGEIWFCVRTEAEKQIREADI